MKLDKNTKDKLKFLGIFILAMFLVSHILGMGILDRNKDGDVDSMDLRYCISKDIDCNYPALLGAIKESGVTQLAINPDAKCILDECVPGNDFAVLECIDAWSLAKVGDFDVLSCIDSWEGVPVPTEPTNGNDGFRLPEPISTPIILIVLVILTGIYVFSGGKK